MTPHASKEGTPRTDAALHNLLGLFKQYHDGHIYLADLEGFIVGAMEPFRALELENQSLQRRVGELEAREQCLRRAVETASIQLQTAARRIADSGNASLGELVLGWSQAARATLQKGNKA